MPKAKYPSLGSEAPVTPHCPAGNLRFGGNPHMNWWDCKTCGERVVQQSIKGTRHSAPEYFSVPPCEASTDYVPGRKYPDPQVQGVHPPPPLCKQEQQGGHNNFPFPGGLRGPTPGARVANPMGQGHWMPPNAADFRNPKGQQMEEGNPILEAARVILAEQKRLQQERAAAAAEAAAQIPVPKAFNPPAPTSFSPVDPSKNPSAYRPVKRGAPDHQGQEAMQWQFVPGFMEEPTPCPELVQMAGGAAASSAAAAAASSQPSSDADEELARMLEQMAAQIRSKKGPTPK